MGSDSPMWAVGLVTMRAWTWSDALQRLSEGCGHDFDWGGEISVLASESAGLVYKAESVLDAFGVVKEGSYLSGSAANSLLEALAGCFVPRAEH